MPIVGIGTTSPGQKLTVAGTIESTSGGIKFPDGTTQSTASGTPLSIPINDVTLSRAIGTIYQNTTGAPIFALVTLARTNTGNMWAYVGPASPPTIAVTTTSTGSGWAQQMLFIVPVGYYYRVTENTGATLNTWIEYSAIGGGGGTQWSTNGANVYYNSGNVGIGTSTPSNYGHGGTVKVLELGNAGTGIHSQSQVFVTSQALLADSAIGGLSAALPAASSANKGVGYLSFSTGSASTSANPTAYMSLATRNTADASFVERVRITESGNVGIGTTTPTVALDVNGGTRSGSSTMVTTCGSGQANGEGTVRNNYTTHGVEYCNGITWAPMTIVRQVVRATNSTPVSVASTNWYGPTTPTFVTSSQGAGDMISAVSASITPTSATSVLHVTAMVTFSSSSASVSDRGLVLFLGPSSSGNAFAKTLVSAAYGSQLTASGYVTAGTTSSVAITAAVGSSFTTNVVNPTVGAGSMTMPSTLIITEYSQ